jgi:hypothetical protein
MNSVFPPRPCGRKKKIKKIERKVFKTGNLLTCIIFIHGKLSLLRRCKGEGIISIAGKSVFSFREMSSPG